MDVGSSGSSARISRAIGTALQIALIVIIIGFVSLIAFVLYGLISGGPKVRAEIAAARDVGPALMRSIEARPGAVPVGPRTEAVRQGRSTLITYGQVFDAPGSFSATVDWYAADLTRHGWRLIGRDADSARLEQGLWSLWIRERHFSQLPDPSCRYEVSLRWSTQKYSRRSF